MKKILLLLLLLPGIAAAQNYPTKPVRMIIPFAPGGASDFVGRIIQPRLSDLLGQQVVIENRAGASGNVGMAEAARSAPDGYTIYLGNVGTVAINPAVFTSLTVKPMQDFIAVTQVVDVPGVLVAHPAFPPNSLKEMIAYAKANPGKINFASPGSGSQNRLEMELIKKSENLDMVHVPYKGGAGPAVTGLMAGETHMMFTTVSSALGQIQGGRLKALVVVAAKRLAPLPSVPTMVESGVPGFVVTQWHGMLAPRGTPRPVIERLHREIARAVQRPEVAARLALDGTEGIASSPQEFAAHLKSEREQWAKVAKQANIRGD